ncbi:tonsoku-like protein isoform X2 [Puntigrus tetrazona]|uniref:tonsoku-like protein isoform X2 n=1 Tax=Puntigrus tetrazona TaxID=1606681 RepID=UPI001C892F88|nr:tonsoku-like protein isoform X2 [Puntigrus tetrazona]
MTSTKEIKLLQKAKSKAQSSNNLKEEASLCNQLGEVYAKTGDYRAAIEEHRQELSLSEILHDVIGSAVANRKIGECYAELGNIEAALKHQRLHLNLARSVHDAAEEQRALATIGRTYLFLFDSDGSRDSLKHAEDAFKKSLAIVDERLEGTVSSRELSEMKARLLLNLGCVYDGMKEPQRCSDFIRQSIYIAEKNHLLEDLYRANFNLGSIHFRNGQHSRAMRCFEQSKDCGRKMKDKFSESECFHSIGKILLHLGDFAAARRSLKKAFCLGSQQPSDREAVKRDFKHAIRGCQLEQMATEVTDKFSHEAMDLSEQLGDLYCKVGCYNKALEAYQTQLACAEAIGKPARELAVIYVSLAATYTDLRQHHRAVEHYRQELKLREGNPKEECETWLNIAGCEEEIGRCVETLDHSFSAALSCAERSGLNKLQRRVLRAWLQAQRRCGSSQCDDTEARLLELCEIDGLRPEDSEEEDEEEEVENSEPLEDSDIQYSDSDEDLEGYDKMVTGRRKTQRWNRRNEKGETVLHRACIEGNLKQVQCLLDQGHPVNLRDYCGWTALHEACNYGHQEIVALLLDRGANVNDPGGRDCEGVTPLHDALNCGHFHVARLLVRRGASVAVRNRKGLTPLDTLRQWFKTYSRQLDQETKQECLETEKLIKRALSGDISVVSALPRQQRELQDSQLFDAEFSEQLLQESQESPPSPQQIAPTVPTPKHSGPGRRSASGPARRPRGMEADVLYGSDSNSDSDCSLGPLRPVRSRPCSPAQEFPPGQDVPSVFEFREAGLPAQTEPGRVEYQKAMQNLGSAKSCLFSQSLSEPAFASTPAVSANSRAALVPEDQYVADDWLEDDLSDVQPKKKRRVSEHNVPREAASRNQNHFTVSAEASPRVQSSSSRGLSLKKGTNKSRQVKMNQMPGMVNLGRREVSRSQSPIMTQESEPIHDPAPPTHQPMLPASFQNRTAHVPAPIRMRVRVQDNVFLIPVPHSEADSCTVAWLCDQAAQRHYQTCGLLPRLSLQKEGALLLPTDPLLAVLHTNEEVLAEVCSWDLPPLPERYRKACQSLGVEENRRVSRLCEVQDGGSCVNVCGLSLPPASLTPLLRALKLQASLTELRVSANRLNNHLLPELMSAAATMPKLRILDISANQITGEGIKKASDLFETKSQAAFPCLEELNLSMNPLGDGWTQALAGLLSSCPLLSALSLQACGLSARFLQQHRLLLANAMASTGNMRSVCLSHNALGSTGFELVLKTLPMNCLTHLQLSAVCRGPSDQPAMEILAKLLTQGDCPLTHLNLAGNGLTDHSVLLLARCLPVCPSLVSLDLSANPSVTSVGLQSLLNALMEAQRPLTHLSLQGCRVSGPLADVCLDSLSDHIRDLRLCSQSLNKLDQDALQQSWRRRSEPMHVFFRNSKCMLSITAASQ